MLTNICGILVQTNPGKADFVALQCAALDGVELHASAGDGRLVVTVEDSPGVPAHDRIMQIHQIPGVIAVTLTYHSFEDLGAPSISAA